MRRSSAHLPVVVTLIIALALAAFSFAASAARSGQVRLASVTSARGPMFGATASSQPEFSRDTADFGHMAIIHVFYPRLPSSSAWTRGVMATSKSAVIVTFFPSPSDVLSGRDNAALSKFFDSAPRGRSIYWSYGHEPEHAIAHGGLNLSQDKAAWAVIARIAKAANNPDLHSTIILEAYDLNPGTHRNWKSYMPAAGVISTLGWDAYPGNAGHGKLEPPSQFMGLAVAASKAAHMPFGFPEFGVVNLPGRAAWLASVGAYVKSSGARFATLFDEQGTPLNVTDQASIKAWRSVVQSSGGDPAAGPQLASASVQFATTYKVRNGDTLSSIAAAQYGSARWWPQI
jgi:hypothetical protein